MILMPPQITYASATFDTLILRLSNLDFRIAICFLRLSIDILLPTSEVEGESLGAPMM